MSYLNKFRRVLVLAALAVSIASCEKEFEKLIVEDIVLGDKALVKIYNGTISSTRTQFFADDTKITGSALAYGGIFPSTGYAAALDPGNRSLVIRDTLATSVQPVITIAANLEAGKNYSIFTYDTVNAIKYVMTTDEIVQPADTTARLRFANLVFSRTPVTNVDLYSVRANGNLFSNIPIGEVTGFIPFASKLTDSLYIRATGTTVNLTPVLTVTPTPKRSYTVIFRGRYQTTTGTVMPRGLSLLTNY